MSGIKFTSISFNVRAQRLTFCCLLSYLLKLMEAYLDYFRMWKYRKIGGELASNHNSRLGFVFVQV